MSDALKNFFTKSIVVVKINEEKMGIYDSEKEKVILEAKISEENSEVFAKIYVNFLFERGYKHGEDPNLPDFVKEAFVKEIQLLYEKLREESIKGGFVETYVDENGDFSFEVTKKGFNLMKGIEDD